MPMEPNPFPLTQASETSPNSHSYFNPQDTKPQAKFSHFFPITASRPSSELHPSS